MFPFPFIIILALLLGLVFLAHFFVYFSLARLFSISQPLIKITLFSSLALLSVSFLVASWLAGWHENIVTRALYITSAVWLGTMINLMLAFSLAWVLLLIAGHAGLAISPRVMGVVALAGASLVSAYGVWVAMHPQVVRVTVHIPDLPEQWRGQTIVQLTDVHIGHVYKRGFVRGVVDQVNAIDPKMVVITGDLFDGMDGVFEEAVRPLNDIQVPEGTYFVTGNHETYLGVGNALAALQTTKVKVLDDQVADADGLKVIGISFPARGENKDVSATLQALAPQFSGQPNIYLYHAPVNIKEAKDAGVNLQLSGHTHRGQQWPFRYITQMIFDGYDYGLHTDGDFSIYTSSGVGTWGPPVRIGTRSEIVAITLK